MRGRRPAPTVLKLVKNTAPRNLNPDEPKVTADLPQAPDWMTADQKAVWDLRVADCPKGMLRSLDQDMLASYCCAVVERDIAIKQLKKNPSRLVKTPKGYLVQSPYVGMMNRQTLIIAKLASELGFSPTSRSRIKVPKGSKDSNPFAGHAARRPGAA